MNPIKKQREKINITQKQLADLLKVERSTVSKWEVGISYPRTTMLPILSKILKCTVDDLLSKTTA